MTGFVFDANVLSSKLSRRCSVNTCFETTIRRAKRSSHPTHLSRLLLIYCSFGLSARRAMEFLYIDYLILLVQRFILQVPGMPPLFIGRQYLAAALSKSDAIPVAFSMAAQGERVTILDEGTALATFKVKRFLTAPTDFQERSQR